MLLLRIYADRQTHYIIYFITVLLVSSLLFIVRPLSLYFPVPSLLFTGIQCYMLIVLYLGPHALPPFHSASIDTLYIIIITDSCIAVCETLTTF